MVVAFYRIYPVERHIHWLPGAVGTLLVSLMPHRLYGGMQWCHGLRGVFSYLVPGNSLTVVKVAR